MATGKLINYDCEVHFIQRGKPPFAYCQVFDGGVYWRSINLSDRYGEILLCPGTMTPGRMNYLKGKLRKMAMGPVFVVSKQIAKLAIAKQLNESGDGQEQDLFQNTYQPMSDTLLSDLSKDMLT